jgi:hypothetical protein
MSTQQTTADLIRAYRKASAALEAERRANLARLTPEESWAIFAELCRIWESLGRNAGGDLTALERLRVESRVERRRKLDRVAAHRGLL